MTERRGKMVAFVTNSQFPDSPPDDRLAITELERRGLVVRPAIWDSEEIDWSSFDLIVLRSPWDYPSKYNAFLRWVERAARAAPLWNPPSVVGWNSHKSYLLDLERSGIDIVPTALLRQGCTDSLAELQARRGWTDLVVKPAIGGSSSGLRRVPANDLDAGEQHLTGLLQTGDALVQPFVPTAQSLGERSLVFFNGTFAYAIDYPYVLETDPRQARPATPQASELATGVAILRTIAVTPLYARIDFMPAPEGGWLLGELELIEPELLLRGDPTAPGKFADAIEQRLRSRSGPATPLSR